MADKIGYTEQSDHFSRKNKYFFWFILTAVVVGVALTGIGALVEIPFFTPVIIGFMKSLSVSTGVGIGLAAFSAVASVCSVLSYAFSRIKKGNEPIISPKAPESTQPIKNPSVTPFLPPIDTERQNAITSYFAGTQKRAQQRAIENLNIDNNQRYFKLD